MSVNIPDNYIIVRGGQSEMPMPGIQFSASLGATVEASAAGVPHGMIRWAIAGDIRGGGGRIDYEPEVVANSGIINRQHVHVTEGGTASVFGPVEPNPVPKRQRIGGHDYRQPTLPE